MRKEITREDGFNIALINHYWEGGDCLCTLQVIETDEQGVETVVREQSDIILKDGVDFVLTEEELEELNPKPVINEEYTGDSGLAE